MGPTHGQGRGGEGQPTIADNGNGCGQVNEAGARASFVGLGRTAHALAAIDVDACVYGGGGVRCVVVVP